MKYKKILFSLGTIIGVSTISIPTISANTNKDSKNYAGEYFEKNFVNNTQDVFEKYWNNLNVNYLKNEVQNIKGVNVGIIDGDTVDPFLFIRDKDEKLYTITSKNTIKKNGDNKFYYEPIEEKFNYTDLKNYNHNARKSQRHSTTIANILAGKYGVTSKSDVYSAKINDKEWENEAHFNKILESFRQNNVKIINMSLGDRSYFRRFISIHFSSFSESLFKFYRKQTHFQGRISFDTIRDFYKSDENKISFMKDLDLKFENEDDLITKIYFNMIFSYIDNKSSKNLNIVNQMWRDFFGYDRKISEYVAGDLTRLLENEGEKELVKKEYKTYAKKFLNKFEQIFLKKYLWASVYEQKFSEFSWQKLQALIKDDAEKKVYYGDFKSKLIDEYSRNYGMKFVISAGNDEEDLFLLRLINKENKSNSLQDYYPINYYNLDSIQINKSAKNAIYVGSTDTLGNHSIFSTQGDYDRDDYPFVSSYGEMKFDELKINPEYFKNPYVASLFSWIVGTSYAAPSIAGGIALIETKLNNQNKNLTISEIKSALMSSSKYKAWNDDYFNFKSDWMNSNDAEGYLLHKANSHVILGYGTPDFKILSQYFDNSKTLFLNGTNTYKLNFSSENSKSLFKLKFDENLIKEIQSSVNADEDIEINIGSVKIKDKVENGISYRLSLSWENPMIKKIMDEISQLFSQDKYKTSEESLIENAFEDIMDLIDLDTNYSDGYNEWNPLTLHSNGKNTSSEMILLNRNTIFTDVKSEYNFDLVIKFKASSLPNQFNELSAKDYLKFKELRSEFLRLLLSNLDLTLAIGRNHEI
ncbi:S8 family serine peptidase [Mycoplasma sp. VS31B]